MPETRSLITSTFFINLINRLGIRPPPPVGFEISNTVVPVSLVDSDITLATTTGTPLMDTPFTQGIIVGGAAGTLLADTGAQPAGNYFLVVMMASQDAAGNMALERRNAANGANVWSQFFNLGTSSNSVQILTIHALLLVNERFRVTINPLAAGANNYQASIWLIPG